MRIRRTLFADMAKGGYFRKFECVDYPGMSGYEKREDRNSVHEVGIVIDGHDTVYKDSKSAIAAYEELKGKLAKDLK